MQVTIHKFVVHVKDFSSTRSQCVVIYFIVVSINCIASIYLGYNNFDFIGKE